MIQMRFDYSKIKNTLELNNTKYNQKLSDYIRKHEKDQHINNVKSGKNDSGELLKLTRSGQTPFKSAKITYSNNRFRYNIHPFHLSGGIILPKKTKYLSFKTGNNFFRAKKVVIPRRNFLLDKTNLIKRIKNVPFIIF